MCKYPELCICLSACFFSVWYKILQRREGIFKNSGQLLVCAIIYLPYDKSPQLLKGGCTILALHLFSWHQFMWCSRVKEGQGIVLCKQIQPGPLSSSSNASLKKGEKCPIVGPFGLQLWWQGSTGAALPLHGRAAICAGSQPWNISAAPHIWLCCSSPCHVLLCSPSLCVGFPNPWFTYPLIAFCTPVPLEVDSFICWVEVGFQGMKAVVDRVRDGIQALQMEMEWVFFCLKCSRIIEREITPEMDHLIFFQASYTPLGSPCCIGQITQSEGQEWKMDGLTP